MHEDLQQDFNKMSETDSKSEMTPSRELDTQTGDGVSVRDTRYTGHETDGSKYADNVSGEQGLKPNTSEGAVDPDHDEAAPDVDVEVEDWPKCGTQGGIRLDQGEGEVTTLRSCGLCEDSNPAEGRCLECSEDLCSNCIKYHEKLRVTSSHNVLPFEPGATSDIVVPARSSTNCPKHQEPLKFFCQMCKVAVCRDCVLTAHKDHQAVDLTDELDNAKKDVERLLKRVQNSVRQTEREVSDLRTYQNEFLDKVQNVSDVIDKLHIAVLQRVEKSHQELTKMIKMTKEEEMRRVEQLEDFFQQRLLSASDFTAVADHVLASQDGIEVMVKLEMLRQSVSPLCEYASIDKGHAEFFLAKNQRFTGNTAENILGRVAFSVMSPPVGGGVENKAFIREIRLKREVAFHIWEMHCTKPSVRGIVEGSNGLLWVATPRSLLTVADNGSRKNSAHLTSDVASIAGGPDGCLLVAFTKGNAIRVLTQDNLTSFTAVPNPITALAGSADGQRILVPQISRASAKLLVVCNVGRDIVSVGLSEQLVETYIPSLAVAPDGEVAMCISMREIVVILSSSFDYKTDYHGPDGVLYPRSVCYDKLGHLIVADSKRCTVQLVSKDGFFLAYLLNKEDFQDIGSPTSVTVDSRGRLWIGTGNGNVCAYTYMHDIM